MAGVPPFVTNEVTLLPANARVELCPALMVLGVAVNVTPLGAGGAVTVTCTVLFVVLPPGPVATRE